MLGCGRYHTFCNKQNLACLRIVDETLQQMLKHLQHSLPIPKCGRSCLVDDLVCLGIVDEICQLGLEHLQHSLPVPKCGCSDYRLANPPNNIASCNQSWNQELQQPHTLVHLQVQSKVEV